MDIEEEISERIIRQAFQRGGEVIFTDTELKECTDRNFLQKDLDFLMQNHLQMYIQQQTIHGIDFVKFVKTRKINIEYLTEQSMIQCHH